VLEVFDVGVLGEGLRDLRDPAAEQEED